MSILNRYSTLIHTKVVYTIHYFDVAPWMYDFG